MLAARLGTDDVGGDDEKESVFARLAVSADEILSTYDNGGTMAAVLVPKETIVVMLRPS